MKFRKTLLVALCAASIGGLAAPMTASAEVRIYLNTAPPPMRYEAVPAPRAGYIWAPGYWNARNNRHYWQAGHWERERKGYHYNRATITTSRPGHSRIDGSWKADAGTRATAMATASPTRLTARRTIRPDASRAPQSF